MRSLQLGKRLVTGCICVFSICLLVSSCGKIIETTTTVPIAQNYPGDIGIENDPEVLFVEMGEESSEAELFARWSANSASGSVALDSSTVPSSSPGTHSIRLSTTAGTLGVGATLRTAQLYKFFSDGYEGTVYLRWYARYNTYGTFHHSGPRLGGNNPGSAAGPNSPAGVKPSGSDFFYLGAELSGAKAAPSTTSPVDFYNYWMNQRGTSYFPGLYYGNSFINDSTVKVSLSEWNCYEVRLKLNDGVDASNGEISMWLNGNLVSTVTSGTIGTWTEDNFTPGSSGEAFEGFQWRNSSDLKFNYLQILHYVDHDPDGMVNSVYYDHIVLARKYIGPIH